MLDVLLIVAVVICAPLIVARLLYLCGIWTRLEPMQLKVAKEDQLEEIRVTAIFMKEQLHTRIDRVSTDKTQEWATMMAGFYARLETLASSSSASKEDALQLAKDASEYISVKRLKGFFITEEA